MNRKCITLELDESLLRKLDEAARAASIPRNQFIAVALARQLCELEDERLDRAFERMGRDPERRKMLMELERELAPASDELLRWLYQDEVREGRIYDT